MFTDWFNNAVNQNSWIDANNETLKTEHTKNAWCPFFYVCPLRAAVRLDWNLKIIEVQLIIHVQQNDTCGIILNKNVVFTDEEPHNRWSDMI